MQRLVGGSYIRRASGFLDTLRIDTGPNRADDA